MGDPRADLARAVDELESLVDGGADADVVEAKMREASDALHKLVEADRAAAPKVPRPRAGD